MCGSTSDHLEGGATFTALRLRVFASHHNHVFDAKAQRRKDSRFVQRDSITSTVVRIKIESPSQHAASRCGHMLR